MATPLSASTTFDSEKIELHISIVGGGGATHTSSGTAGASPDYVCETPTSVLDDSFAGTANFDVAASDETSSDGDSSDSSEADLPADIESALRVESDEEDELVRQIISEIRKNGLQPRGGNKDPVKPKKSASNPMKEGRSKAAGPAEKKGQAATDRAAVQSTVPTTRKETKKKGTK